MTTGATSGSIFRASSLFSPRGVSQPPGARASDLHYPYIQRFRGYSIPRIGRIARITRIETPTLFTRSDVSQIAARCASRRVHASDLRYPCIPRFRGYSIPRIGWIARITRIETPTFFTPSDLSQVVARCESAAECTHLICAIRVFSASAGIAIPRIGRIARITRIETPTFFTLSDVSQSVRFLV